MKRFWVGWITLCLGMWVLFSCGAAQPRSGDFDYADGAFSAVLRGTYTPSDGVLRPVTAEVTVGAPAREGAPRNLRITFSQPPALAGVTVSAAADGATGERVVTFTAVSPHGTVTAVGAGGEYDGLLRFAEALIPAGDVVSVSPVEEDGTHTVTRRTAEGDGETVYRFGAGGGLPLQVTARTGEEILELAVSAADGDHAGRP